MLNDRQLSMGVLAIGVGVLWLAYLAFQRRRLQDPAISNEEVDRNFFRPLAYIARPATYVALLIAVYSNAPRSVLNIPLASLTLGDIFGWLAWGAFGLLIFWSAFNPSENEETKDLWGIFGLLLLFCGFIYFVYIRPDFIASLLR
ncbi:MULTISPECIES: hypothetical protein [unclassified Bradyrhizobium]|uniref:hypothetical protein n=2 Tax=unclassified Bradyrhizobium TaxID=2631580 RepID=UPI0028E530A3|nr:MULTISPECIES: hypothetical protein [unclassified Bradyrhizobium]